MMDWKPISEAPPNVVVLTDEGFAIFTCPYHCHESNKLKLSQWYLCSPSGYIISCADEGVNVSRVDPTIWCHLSDIGL